MDKTKINENTWRVIAWDLYLFHPKQVNHISSPAAVYLKCFWPQKQKKKSIYYCLMSSIQPSYWSLIRSCFTSASPAATHHGEKQQGLWQSGYSRWIRQQTNRKKEKRDSFEGEKDWKRLRLCWAWNKIQRERKARGSGALPGTPGSDWSLSWERGLFWHHTERRVKCPPAQGPPQKKKYVQQFFFSEFLIFPIWEAFIHTLKTKKQTKTNIDLNKKSKLYAQ